MQSAPQGGLPSQPAPDTQSAAGPSGAGAIAVAPTDTRASAALDPSALLDDKVYFAI